MSKPRNFLSNRLGVRANVGELLLIAVVLGLGVNLIATVIAEWIGDWTTIALGLALTLLACALIFYAYFRSYKFSQEISAALFIDPKTQMPLSADGYDFSRHCEMYLESAFRENPALRRQWMNKPAPDSFSPLGSPALVRELVEYIVLEKLSMYLGDHFNQSGHRKDELHTYKRNDLPDILLANRFLELFSRDVADRAGFHENDGKVDGPDEPGVKREVVAIFGEHYFHRFELTLPVGSTVLRATDGIVIAGPTLELRIEIEFHGYGASNPWRFTSRYMKREYDQVRALQVDVCITAKVKKRLQQSRKDLSREMWAEEVVDKLYKSLDFDHFISTINWPVVSAIIGATGPEGDRSRGRFSTIGPDLEDDVAVTEPEPNKPNELDGPGGPEVV